MKKAIVTIAIGEFHEKLYNLVRPYFEAYAEKVGADLIVWEDQGEHSMPHYRKLDLGDLLDHYDRICYVDCDILIRPDAPNIFDAVPYAKFGAFEEGSLQDRSGTLAQFFRQMQYTPQEDVQADYWNTGVMVFSKLHQPIFLQPEQEMMSFYEQTYLNFMLHALQVHVFNLNYRFNRMSLINSQTGEDRCDGWFIHYAGFKDVHGEAHLLETVKKDIERIKDAAPEYKFKRKFLIAVQGGIGDQVESEPAIRHLTTKVYPGEEFHVCSFWPSIFSHLPVKLYDSIEKVEGRDDMHVMQTYRDHTDDSWGKMSQGAMHIVDFSAIQLMKMTVPMSGQQPKLQYSVKDLENLLLKMGFASEGIFDKAVLVHPGRGWPSKTFPPEVWNGYLSALIEAGFCPILIGKDSGGEHGVVQGIDTAGCMNMINNTTLQEMFALIANAKVLISNDSSPVHIAGAYSNWIGMIGGPKQPEMVFPRRGPIPSPFYRTAVLEKNVPKKRYEKHPVRPAEMYPESMDHMHEDIREYCPKPEVIVKFVEDVFDGRLPDYPEGDLR